MTTKTAGKSLLVVDDEQAICYAFRRFFEARGWEVHDAPSAKEGLLRHRELRPDVSFVDVRLPDRSGLDLLLELGQSTQTPVVIITAYSNLDTTVNAMQARAFDYLVKPLDLDEALQVAERALDSRGAAQAAAKAAQPSSGGTLIGDSPAMQAVYKLIARAAAADTPVLITGPTGTGKELTARAIHGFSARREGPFVAVNCGALPEGMVERELFGAARGSMPGVETDRPGRFELANGGTLLLDEVSDLPMTAQVKLLRVLEANRVERLGETLGRTTNVRIVATTNQNLELEVQAGTFRPDLYYRLAVFPIELPRLRDRTEDITPLAKHFLSLQPNPASADLSADAIGTLLRYDWPGNVRELKNAMLSAAARSPGRKIVPEDLPEAVRCGRAGAAPAADRFEQAVLDHLASLEDAEPQRYGKIMEQVERALIDHALKRFRGRKVEAAQYLGLHRNTLRNRIRELNLDDQGE